MSVWVDFDASKVSCIPSMSLSLCLMVMGQKVSVHLPITRPEVDNINPLKL